MIITMVIIVVPSPQTASGEWGPGYEAKILVWVVKNLRVRVHRITLNNKSRQYQEPIIYTTLSIFLLIADTGILSRPV